MKKVITLVVAVVFISNVSFAQKRIKVNKNDYMKIINQLNEIEKERKSIQDNLKTFDELDYDIFSNQQWERLHESHADNVIVNWPDGHRTYGLERHIKDLKFLFVFAPDTRIKTHPIRIGEGNLTAVMGIMEGTFTKPMPIGEGKVIQPTGKSFSIPMATIGRWKDGEMIEEYLFWDNKTYYEQLGL